MTYKLKNPLLILDEQIETAMNSEDDIDRTYLLEAVQKDLHLIFSGEPPKNVQELIDNPIS